MSGRCVAQWSAAVVTILCLPAVLLALYSRRLRRANAERRDATLQYLGVSRAKHDGKRLVGFFHPYCNAGGGGERVLWTAVALLQRTSPEYVSVVYSGDGEAGKDDIIATVKSRFNIELDSSRIHFVFLESRNLVEDSTWPRFTLLGQSLGSMYLAWEAMTKLMPDIYIDTMGYSFTFLVVKWLAGVPVGAYVHYPTISTDMLARVKSRKQWHTNTDSISSSASLSGAKLIYYRLFMYLYAGTLRQAAFLMVNSSWTKNHIDNILVHKDALLDSLYLALFLPFTITSSLFTKQYSAPRTARIVYPPCETQELVGFPLQGRERVILSVAQFRPEKEHATQLRAFHTLLSDHPEYRSGPAIVRLVLIGGSRNREDSERVESLRALAKELGISANVDIVVNASHANVLSWLSHASIGLSTMVDEHFGINVVEFLAAGIIPVTHASGGPLHDIVVPYHGEPTGYHAKRHEEFARALHDALSLGAEDDIAMRQRGREWALEAFSREGFERAWEASGWRSLLEGKNK